MHRKLIVPLMLLTTVGCRFEQDLGRDTQAQNNLPEPTQLLPADAGSSPSDAGEAPVPDGGSAETDAGSVSSSDAGTQSGGGSVGSVECEWASTQVRSDGARVPCEPTRVDFTGRIRYFPTENRFCLHGSPLLDEFIAKAKQERGFINYPTTPPPGMSTCMPKTSFYDYQDAWSYDYPSYPNYTLYSVLRRWPAPPGGYLLGVHGVLESLPNPSGSGYCDVTLRCTDALFLKRAVGVDDEPAPK